MSSIPNATPNVISASGAIPALRRYNNLNSAAPLALSLSNPDVDGQEAWLTDESGRAHVISVSSGGLNAGAHSTITFSGVRGSSVGLVSRNGSWFTLSLTGVTVT